MPKCRPAIASMSLGRAYASHALSHKISCAARSGFGGIEIFYEDLEYLARDQKPESEVGNQDHSSSPAANGVVANPDSGPSKAQLLKAAGVVKELCRESGIEIIGLQPFLFYEGLVDKKEHEAMIEKLHLWFRIAKALGTDVIQIPTQFRRDEGVTGDMDAIVKDMVEVADLGLKEEPPIKFAYENLAWGTFIDTWDGVWEVVTRVDRWNFGVCLDTFNIAGRVWADPEKEDGTVGPQAGKELESSVKRMVREVDVKKVWYVQVVGAERMKKPLVEGHEWYVEGQPARMSWSRNARLFYGEEEKGQYLPVELVARAILDPVGKGGLGFEGWVSMELFSRTMNDQAKTVPNEHANRGGEAWSKLVRALDLR